MMEGHPTKSTERSINSELEHVLPMLFPDQTTRQLVVACYNLTCIEDLVHVLDVANFYSTPVENTHGNLNSILDISQPNLFPRLFGGIASDDDWNRVTAFLFWFQYEMLKHMRDGAIIDVFRFDQNTLDSIISNTFEETHWLGSIQIGLMQIAHEIAEL